MNSHKKKRLAIFLYKEEICNKYFVSLKASKMEEFIPQIIWPYLLPYHFITLFYLFKAYRDDICKSFKYYTLFNC